MMKSTGNAVHSSFFSLLATGVSLLALIAVIVINMLVGMLPDSLTKLDCTKDEIFTLSNETRAVLESVKEPIVVYFVASAGEEDVKVRELLAQYLQLTEHIEVQRIDPQAYPQFAAKYTAETVQNNSLIVESSRRFQVLNYRNITTFSSFRGEQLLTNALSYVTAETLPVVYELSGHGESTLDPDLISALQEKNMELRPLHLANAQIPDDAGCVLINSPATDLSEREQVLLTDYLAGGGRIMLVTDYTSEPRPNILSLPAAYGAALIDGVIFEENPNYYIMGNPYYLMPDLMSHEVTDPMLSGSYYVLIPLAQGIRWEKTVGNAVYQRGLLKTSETAYAKRDIYVTGDSQRAPDDEAGPFELAAVMSNSAQSGQSRLMWITGSSLLSEDFNNLVSGSNFDFFLNGMSWLCEQESTSTIRARELTNRFLIIRASDSRLWGILLIGIFPLTFLCIGTVVWLRRRSR
jgi:ABC-2 type transport system permease protein